MSDVPAPDEPDLSAEPGWTPAPPFATLIYGRERVSRSFVSGVGDETRLRVRYYVRDADGALVGKAWFGPGCEGPPRHAHGGSMSALMDEALGHAAWEAGYPVVAANLNVNFRRMLPLGTVTRFEARVDRVDGRKVRVSGKLTDAAGKRFADATGLFVVLSDDDIEKLRALL